MLEKLAFVYSLTQIVIFDCLFVSAEEERKVKANDREYNEKFQYAVRASTVVSCWYPKLFNVIEHDVSLNVEI